MRRRRVIIGLVVLALGAGAVVAWLCRPQPCRETFERVQVGMTLREVEAVVGRPPGSYQTNYIAVVGDADGYNPPPETWTADDAELSVYLDESGRVGRIVIRDVRPMPDSRTRLERLRDRLGL
jgi:hypothetical protein